MRPDQFSLRKLFACTTLIALGLGMVSLPFGARFGNTVWYLLLLPQVLRLFGGALIGTGILAPFDKAAFGAIIGFVVQVVVFYTYFVPFES
jgi:hypothetical protein